MHEEIRHAYKTFVGKRAWESDTDEGIISSWNFKDL
jgi:hypothetical protein